MEYVVELCYSCYATVVVEADSEDDALDKARQVEVGVVQPDGTCVEIDGDSLARWSEADMVSKA